MKTIRDIENLKGKRVIVRVDFNVPIQDGKITDDFRIKKALPTIEYLAKKGASVILISHLGKDGTASLKPIALRLKKYIPTAEFISTPILSNETEDRIAKLKKGNIILLENLRSEAGEKSNFPSFARALSRYGDIYINEAFPESHRPYASIIGITKYLPGYAGFQFEEEIRELSRAFDPSHPFLFILGGNKFETKIPLIKKFARSADSIFIGGAIANNFFKTKGYEVGTSLVDPGTFDVASLLKNSRLLLPIDVEAVRGKKTRFCKPETVSPDENILDVGPQTIAMLKDIAQKSKFILWNGPLGKYENGFAGATEQLLKIISKSDAKTIVGGGDTVAFISKFKLEKKFGFVSTGGGATLDFLAKGTLPGIKVLR